MKKYVILFIALLSVELWSCGNDEDPDKTVPSISLSSPAADEPTIDLNTTTEVTFSWAVTNGSAAGGYTLYLSKTEDLSSPRTYTASNLSIKVSSVNLDIQLKEWGIAKGEESVIYWYVKPTVAGEAIPPETARALKLKRLPMESTVGSMRNVQVRPGYERVLLSWEQNPDPLIETVVIYWNDKKNSVEVELVRREEGWQKDSVYIPDLTEGVQYTFELVNKNSSGNQSSPVIASGTPYGAQRAAELKNKTRKLTGIMMTGYSPEAGSRDNSPVTIGSVTLTWEAAPEGSIATKIRYKKVGDETIVYVKEPNAGAVTNLTGAGNRLLHPDDILYVSTLFLPDGGIDTLQSNTLQSQMVVYMVKDEPRARLNYDLPSGKWSTAAYDWKLQKLLWAINQETITVLDCNRFGCFNALGGTNFLTEYFSTPPIHQFKLEINSNNTVTVTGFYGKGQEDSVNPYTIYNNDQTRGEGGSSADHGVAEGISTFDPETHTLYLNYMRIITANNPKDSKAFFIEELVP